MKNFTIDANFNKQGITMKVNADEGISNLDVAVLCAAILKPCISDGADIDTALSVIRENLTGGQILEDDGVVN